MQKATMSDTQIATRQSGARSVCYHGLAVLFRHPDRQWFDAVRDGKLFAALREIGDSSDCPSYPKILTRLESEFAKCASSLQDLSIDYVRLFGAHGGVNCPPFATEFGSRHTFGKAQDLADITGFYAAFGVEMSKERVDRPDHISFLFEFLSFLALKQVGAAAEGNPEGLAVTGEAEEKFFCKHVIDWVPVFCDALATQARQGFYRELAALTKLFVEAEEKRLGVQIERVTLAKKKSDPQEEACMSCMDS